VWFSVHNSPWSTVAFGVAQSELHRQTHNVLTWSFGQRHVASLHIHVASLHIATWTHKFLDFLRSFGLTSSAVAARTISALTAGSATYLPRTN
jgi:hypothetical protein